MELKFHIKGVFSVAFTGWRWGITICNLASNAAFMISIPKSSKYLTSETALNKLAAEVEGVLTVLLFELG